MDNFCSKPSENFILFDNVVLHILILFSIVSALFMFIIVKLSQEHLDGEFVHMIDKLVNPENLQEIFTNRADNVTLKNIIANKLNINKSDPAQVDILDKLTDKIFELSPSDISGIKTFLTSFTNDYTKNAHALREARNQKVKYEVLMVIAFFIILGVVINFLPRKMGNYCGVLKHLGIELLVIFSCVGAIEYWFFTNVGSKYVPVKPTVIIQTFKETMLKKLNGK